MYVLVYLIENKETAIIIEGFIDKKSRNIKKIEKNDIVQVIKGEKQGEAKVLHVSNNKGHLEKIQPQVCLETGILNVIKKKNPPINSENDGIPIKKPRKAQTSSSLITQSARKETIKQFNQHFTTQCDGQDVTDYTEPPSLKQQSLLADKIISDDTSTATMNNVEEINDSCNNYSDQLTLVDDGIVSFENNPVIDTVSAEQSNDSHMNCECSDIPATPEVIMAFEKVLLCLKRRQKQNSTDSNNITELIKINEKPHWQHITEGKVKLQDGYDVWIYAASLNIIKGLSKNFQSKLFGKLLHHFLGEKLAVLNSKKIPRDVYEASYAYALQNATIPFSQTVGKSANNKCSTEKKSLIKKESKKTPANSMTAQDDTNHNMTKKKKMCKSSEYKENQNIKGKEHSAAEQDSSLVAWNEFSPMIGASSTPGKSTLKPYVNVNGLTPSTTLDNYDYLSNNEMSQNVLFDLDVNSQNSKKIELSSNFVYITDAQSVLLNEVNNN